MNVVYTDIAEAVIDRIAEYIESIHTEGAGERWTDRLLDFIDSYAQPNTKYALCNHRILAALNYSCITHNGLTIAFTIEDGEFIVQDILFGSMLA